MELAERIKTILKPHRVVLDSHEVIGHWSKLYSSIEIKPNNKFKLGSSLGCMVPIITIRKGGKWSLINDKLVLRTRNDLDSMEIYLVEGSYLLANSDINHHSWEEAKILSSDILSQGPKTDEELLQMVTFCLLRKSLPLREK
ncbi:MAG: hypothetical protein RIC80_06620 [Cyclobacteriaceae bacterium]